MVWHLEGRGSYNWKQWCQLIKMFIGHALQDIKVYCSQQRRLSETWADSADSYVHYSIQVSNALKLYFLYLHTANT